MELIVNESGLPILDQFSEEGFVDCVFKIVDLEDGEDTYKFNLRASYCGDDLGFRVEIVKGIKGGFDSEMSLIRENVFKQGVKFFRTGPESDLLLKVLAYLYGISEVADQMTGEEAFTAIALHQGKIDMATESIKIKIFGEDQNEDLEEDYYESYFNLDLKKGLVFWNEKDEDYRESLISGLSA